MSPPSPIGSTPSPVFDDIGSGPASRGPAPTSRPASTTPIRSARAGHRPARARAGHRAAAAGRYRRGDVALLADAAGRYELEVLDGYDVAGVPAVHGRVLRQLTGCGPFSLMPGDTGTWPAAQLSPIAPDEAADGGTFGGAA